MLGTKKLLYILPDVAYSAELLPDKKPFTFALQSCVQVNGEFIEDKVFCVENVHKLFAKLDPDESYQVILPDDLFINKILAIKETSDNKIKQELHANVLPELSLLPDTHTIVTTVLNELRGTSRVQITAISKKVLAPLRAIASSAHITIERIAPLSWSLKSIVSLEPSVVILQMGTMLYGSLHYIGVEQCFAAPTTDLDAITAKIKELKTAEASIMTCYLVTNDLIEAGLKASLKKVLPIQQMAQSVTSQEELPVAVATIIEETMRTLSIPDFPVPQFGLDKASNAEVQEYAPAQAIASTESKGDAMPKATNDETKVVKDAADELPQATPHASTKMEEESDAPAPATIVSPVISSYAASEPTIDLRQFAGAQSETAATSEAVKPIPIKNKSRTMTKMITITLLVFIGTIAAGVGFGMLFLNYTNKSSTSTPIVEIQASPTPMATVEPTPEPASGSSVASGSAKNGTGSATIVSGPTANLKIFVVNATTKAGYAGQIKDLIVKAGFKSAATGNAKGEYTEKGNFVYQKKADDSALQSIEKASGVDLTIDETAKQEDSQGSYDVVIVLNQ